MKPQKQQTLARCGGTALKRQRHWISGIQSSKTARATKSNPVSKRETERVRDRQRGAMESLWYMSIYIYIYDAKTI